MEKNNQTGNNKEMAQKKAEIRKKERTNNMDRVRNNERKAMKRAIWKAPEEVQDCLRDIVKQVTREEERGGSFASMDDFIDRMMAADMDIHAFTMIGQYIPMKFPGNGDAGMLRAVLALRGYDPDYSVTPNMKYYMKELVFD